MGVEVTNDVDLTKLISTGKKTFIVQAGNTKGGSITVPLTSCLTGLE